MKKLKRALLNWLKAAKSKQKITKYSKYNDIRVAQEDLSRLKFHITGKNNSIHIGRLGAVSGLIEIRIHGDNNEIRLGDGLSVSKFLKIVMGAPAGNFGPVHHVRVHIGARSSFEDTQLQSYNSHSAIEIGERCMFSFGINVYNTDAHAILDAESGKVLNYVKTLHIGNHVWVGAYASIMKNVYIADDCIVGWGSVVSGKFDTSNCVLAGNPAKLVRQGITWEANGAQCGYIENAPASHQQ